MNLETEISENKISNNEIFNTNKIDSNQNDTDKKIDTNQNNTDDDNNILSGDNKIDVGIKPDIKDNVVPIQICSCSLNVIFNCFSK
jgi:hypothetical protein